MRWLSFFIFAYIVLGLEAGLGRAIEWHHATPDLVLVAVVFLGLNAPRDTALLGSFVLGFLHDFSSAGTLGLFAFAYGLAAVFVTALQQAINRRHPLTHVLLTAFVGESTAIVLAAHAWLKPPEGGLHAPLVPLFTSALYSAAVAPIVIGLLQKIGGVFHFRTSRSRMA